MILVTTHMTDAAMNITLLTGVNTLHATICLVGPTVMTNAATVMTNAAMLRINSKYTLTILNVSFCFTECCEICNCCFYTSDNVDRFNGTSKRSYSLASGSSGWVNV